MTYIPENYFMTKTVLRVYLYQVLTRRMTCKAGQGRVHGGYL